eukprot:scaffold3134_cov414-Prasinococcus_capsulatus_cf.AAC.34
MGFVETTKELPVPLDILLRSHAGKDGTACTAAHLCGTPETNVPAARPRGAGVTVLVTTATLGADRGELGRTYLECRQIEYGKHISGASGCSVKPQYTRFCKRRVVFVPTCDPAEYPWRSSQYRG